MFEKKAKERAKDYTDNAKRQVAYVCGFLDGVDFDERKMKQKKCRNCKGTGKATLLPDSLAYAKSIIKDLLNNSDEYAKQRARDFLEEK